jgi:insertion element IS1 protein InsB
MNKCHQCHSLEIIKQGFHGNKQRYKCRGCGHQSTCTDAPMSDVEREKRMLRALCLFLSGLSKNAVAKLLGVSCQSVCNWILKMGDPDKLLPKPSGELVCLELDEMWHFLGNKKHKLWIWKAYCRETKTLVAFECGDRDFATLVGLVSKLKGYNVKIFFTDHFGPYQKLIPESMLVQSKSETVAIKQNNGRQRHWLAPFRRRSIVISKSLKILEATLALFAFYHVNNNFSDLIDLVRKIS